MQSWNTKGRAGVAVFDPATRYRITHSRGMVKTCSQQPLLWVVERLIELPFLGGFTGPQQKVELFVCLLFRLIQILPAPPLVLAMLRQDVHKYLRVAAMVFIRLLGGPLHLREAKKVALEDYRKIRVYGSQDLSSSPSLSKTSTQQEQQQRLFSGKRQRQEAEKETLALNEEKNLEESLAHPTRYFITHVDEIGECLFGGLDGEKSSPSEFGTASTQFLGIPLPSIDYY